MSISDEVYPSSQKILISGSRGLVGHALMEFLRAKGNECIPLVRSARRPGRAVYWNPITGEAHKEDFEGFDAVVHLAGESLITLRWTKHKKERLFLSRCRDTWLLSQILTRLHHPPKTLITASAVGFYGDRGSEWLTEDSPAGKSFLADLCVKWEEATASIEERGTRVIHARFGPIFSPTGGMLQRLLTIFRLGLGGRLGDGKHYLSWIALEDVLEGIAYCLMHAELEGPVNFTAPEPVTNAHLTQTLAKAVHRPAILAIPKPLLHLLCGAMADEMLLASARVKSKKLQESGYRFRYSNLEDYFNSL